MKKILTIIILFILSIIKVSAQESLILLPSQIGTVQSIEYVDIDGPGFLEEVRKGGIPTSSQPPIGRTMETFESIEEGALAHGMDVDALMEALNKLVK